MSREAMTFALEALEAGDWYIGQLELCVYSADDNGLHAERAKVKSAITALRAALDAYDQTALELCETCGWKAIVPGDGCLVCARQQIKPVAYADSRIHGWPECFVMEPDPPHTVPLYAAPREWHGLTDEELFDLWMKSPAETEDRFAFVKAALAKQKERNT